MKDDRSIAASTARTNATRRMGSIRTATRTLSIAKPGAKLTRTNQNGSVASGHRSKAPVNRMSTIAARRQTGAATVATSMRRKPEPAGTTEVKTGFRLTSSRAPSVASSRWRAPTAGPVRTSRGVTPPPAPSRASTSRRKPTTPSTAEAPSAKAHASATELNTKFQSGALIAHDITPHLNIGNVDSTLDVLKLLFPVSRASDETPNATVTVELSRAGVFLLTDRSTGRWECLLSKGSDPLFNASTFLLSRKLQASMSTAFLDYFPVAASMQSGKIVLEAAHESNVDLATEKLTALLANAGASDIPALHAPLASPPTRDRSFISFARNAGAFSSPDGKTLLQRILTGLEPANEKLRAGRSKTIPELEAKLNKVSTSLLLGAWAVKVNRKAPANVIFSPETPLDPAQLQLACDFFSAIKASIYIEPQTSPNTIGCLFQFEADSTALDCLLAKTVFMLDGAAKFGKFSIPAWSSVNTSTTSVEQTDTFWLAFQPESAGPAERALQADALSRGLHATTHCGLTAVGPVSTTTLKPLLKAAHKAGKAALAHSNSASMPAPRSESDLAKLHRPVPADALSPVARAAAASALRRTPGSSPHHGKAKTAGLMDVNPGASEKPMSGAGVPHGE